MTRHHKGGHVVFSAADVVTALYNGVLGREPDPDGMKTYVAALTEDPHALKDVARHMHYSDEHARKFTGTGAIADHSQFGEFRIFLKHLVGRGQNHGIIVDVGARGRDRSNSFDLLTMCGWRGLLVEANPSLWDSIRQEFSDTDFALAQCAVSDTEGFLPFFIGANDDVSSLSLENAAAWGDIKGEVQVTVRRLGTILDEHKIPHDFDILSLDIEGLDVRVLNDLVATTQYRPELVVIEASMNFENKSLADAGLNDGVRDAYDLKYQTTANMLLVRRPQYVAAR